MRDLAKGSMGEDVRILQDMLNYHLRRETPLTLDGNFGLKTQARTKQFQTGLQLKSDGIAGFRTRAQLFETHVYPGQVVVFPKLQRPTFDRAGKSVGIAPPRLIPPLTFPQSPQLLLTRPVTFRPPIFLSNTGLVTFQPIRQPSILNMTFRVMPVKDMSDPVVRSTRNLIEHVNQIPLNSKFTALIVGQIPNPIVTIQEPKNSFSFGPISPSYSPLNGNKIGNKSSAAFTLSLFGKPGDITPQIALEGRAEGKIELEYNGRASSSYFKATSEWNFALGFTGVF